MKGRVKIELRDKDGNIVSSQEKDNLVTNFIDDMYVPMAFTKGITGSLLSENREILQMFDTIQLLGEYLSDDPSDYFYGDQTLVGLSRHNMSYGGSNTHYGNFNILESGWNNNHTEYTYIYDWQTSSANDVPIKSVALSPIWTCQAGCGLRTTDYDNAFKDYGLNRIINQFGTSKEVYFNSSYHEYNPYVFDYEQNLMYATNANPFYCATEPTLTLYKVRMPLSKIFRGYHKTHNASFSNEILEKIILNISNEVDLEKENAGFINYANGKIYFLITKKTSLSPQESLNIGVYDIDSNESSEILFTNTSDYTIYFNKDSYTKESNTFLLNNKLLTVIKDPSNEKYPYRHGIFNLEDGSFKLVETAWLYDTTLLPCLYGFNESILYSSGDSTNENDYYESQNRGYDLVSLNGKIEKNLGEEKGPLGMTPGSSRYNAYGPKMVPFKNLPAIAMRVYNLNTSYYDYHFTAFPLVGYVFTTKFNLDEPIVKNNEQSLKVTYTLRFDDY